MRTERRHDETRQQVTSTDLSCYIAIQSDGTKKWSCETRWTIDRVDRAQIRTILNFSMARFRPTARLFVARNINWISSHEIISLNQHFSTSHTRRCWIIIIIDHSHESDRELGASLRHEREAQKSFRVQLYNNVLYEVKWWVNYWERNAFYSTNNSFNVSIIRNVK